MTLNGYRWTFLLGCYFVCAVWPVHGQANQARTVLTGMLANYENAQSYQDSAVLRVFPKRRSLLDGPRRDQPDRLFLSFKTYFRRPQMFRFDWRDSSTETSRNSAIWFDGEQAYSWTGDKFLGKDRFILQRKPDFDALIRDTINLSGGMVEIIPGLLMTSLQPHTFADVIQELADTRIIRKERVDGALCYVISGNASGEPWVFWVDQKTLLLRKMRSFYSIGSFYERSKKGQTRDLIGETTLHQVVINESIPDGVFRYRPNILERDTDLTK